MSTSKAIVYDLGISLGAIGLWLVPVDAVRAVGYATSVVFSARGYYTGIMLLSKERKTDEIEAMNYDAATDFHERLLESSLEIKLQQLENRFTEYIIPIVSRKAVLEKELNRALAANIELSDEEREVAAKEAIESAFDSPASASDNPLDEVEIRKHFPEANDLSNWKAVLKALQVGTTRNEIIKDVLVCPKVIGEAYLALLLKKFM